MPPPTKHIPPSARQVTFFPLDEYATATARVIVNHAETDLRSGWQERVFQLARALLLHTGASRPDGYGSAETVSDVLQGADVHALLSTIAASQQRQVAETAAELLNLSKAEVEACFAVLRSHLASHLALGERAWRGIVADQARAFARAVVDGEPNVDPWKDEAERALAALYAHAAKANPFHDRAEVTEVTARVLQSASVGTWSLLSRSACPLISEVATALLHSGDAKRAAVEAVANHYLTRYQLQPLTGAPTTH